MVASHWPEPPINWLESSHTASTSDIQTKEREALRNRAVQGAFNGATKGNLTLIISAHPGAGKSYFERSKKIWEEFGGDGNPVNLYFDEVVAGDPNTNHGGIPELFEAAIFGHTPHDTTFLNEVVGIGKRVLQKVESEGYNLRRSSPPVNPKMFQALYDRHHARPDQKVGAILVSTDPLLSTERKALRSLRTGRYIGDLLALYRCREASENTIACASIVDELRIYNNDVIGEIPHLIAQTVEHVSSDGSYPSEVVDDSKIEDYIRSQREQGKFIEGLKIPIGNNKYLEVHNPKELEKHFSYKYINPFARNPGELWQEPSVEAIKRLATAIDPDGRKGVANTKGKEAISLLSNLEVNDIENYYYKSKFAAVVPARDAELNGMEETLYKELISAGVGEDLIFYKGLGNYDEVVHEPPFIIDFKTLDFDTKVKAAKILSPERSKFIDEVAGNYIAGVPLVYEAHNLWVARALKRGLHSARNDLSEVRGIDLSDAKKIEALVHHEGGADVAMDTIKWVWDVYYEKQNEVIDPGFYIILTELTIEALLNDKEHPGVVHPEAVEKILKFIDDKSDGVFSEPVQRIRDVLASWLDRYHHEDHAFDTGPLINKIPTRVGGVYPQVTSISFNDSDSLMTIHAKINGADDSEKEYKFTDRAQAILALRILAGQTSVSTERDRLKQIHPRLLENAEIGEFLRVPPLREGLQVEPTKAIDDSLSLFALGALQTETGLIRGNSVSNSVH